MKLCLRLTLACWPLKLGKDEGHNSSFTQKEIISGVGANGWKIGGVGGKDPGGVDSSLLFTLLI